MICELFNTTLIDQEGKHIEGLVGNAQQAFTYEGDMLEKLLELSKVKPLVVWFVSPLGQMESLHCVNGKVARHWERYLVKWNSRKSVFIRLDL